MKWIQTSSLHFGLMSAVVMEVTPLCSSSVPWSKSWLSSTLCTSAFVGILWRPSAKGQGWDAINGAHPMRHGRLVDSVTSRLLWPNIWPLSCVTRDHRSGTPEHLNALKSGRFSSWLLHFLFYLQVVQTSFCCTVLQLTDEAAHMEFVPKGVWSRVWNIKLFYRRLSNNSLMASQPLNLNC